jgi:EpsD family peptidyl-prolyl cis-trans isomerase
MRALSFNELFPLLAAAVAFATLVPLAGCSSEKADGKPATQVAAKVNGAEISVNQINALLATVSGLTSENAPRARKEVLDRLVDQQIAVEQAIAKKLDSNPEVLLNIEAARREILARAYLEQIAAAQPKASDDDVKRYYDENPDLFARRRLYNIEELAIAKTGASLDELKTLIASGKPMEEIANWLKDKNIPTRGNVGARAAEQLPLEFLPRLAQMTDGQTALFEGQHQAFVMRVIASQSAPVDEATVKPRIQQFLQNQRNSKAVADEMKKLKAAAKIELVGDFAKMLEPSVPASAAKPPANAIGKGATGLK